MSLEAVFEVMRGIMLADSLSYWLIGGLTVIAFPLMRMTMPFPGLSFVFAPGLFLGGLTAIYAARHYGIVVSNDKAVQTVAVGVVGLIVALAVMMLLVRLVHAVTRVRRPVTNSVARLRV